MGVAVPFAVLAGLGWLWLWENGYALVWVAATLVLTVLGVSASFLTVRWLEKGSRRGDGDGVEKTKGHPEDWKATYSPREEAAWRAVEALATSVEPKTLTNREAVLSLGVRTVEAVARQIHPDKPDAIWQFTVPEALTLIERVSSKLKPIIAENIPLGDQLSVGHVLRIYRWRAAIDIASKAYDLWRIIRLLNPITAATQEVRERLTKSMYAGLREELAKRLAAAYVREVGRAAIDLYGGRLMVSDRLEKGWQSQAAERDQALLDSPTEPLRLLVAGQAGAGRSSLINALAGAIAVQADALPSEQGEDVVKVSREGVGEIVFIDAAAVAGDPSVIARLCENAGDADLIIWVAGANRADRKSDRIALDAVDSYFDAKPDRRKPGKFLVVTHIDRLKPAREWAPPYDLAEVKNPKAQSIAEAVQTIAQDLDFSPVHAIPVCVGENREPYNIDLVWSTIAELAPEAKRAQIVRLVREAGQDGFNWRRVLGQAAGAGRLIASALKHELGRR